MKTSTPTTTVSISPRPLSLQLAVDVNTEASAIELFVLAAFILVGFVLGRFAATRWLHKQNPSLKSGDDPDVEGQWEDVVSLSTLPEYVAAAKLSHEGCESCEASTPIRSDHDWAPEVTMETPKSGGCESLYYNDSLSEYQVYGSHGADANSDSIYSELDSPFPDGPAYYKECWNSWAGLAATGVGLGLHI